MPKMRGWGLGFSVFRCCVGCGLRFLFYFALGFQVFGKSKIGFSDLRFDGVRCFPVCLRKICASTTSTAHTSSLALIAVVGFEWNIFRFCGSLFVTFSGFWYNPMPFFFLSLITKFQMRDILLQTTSGVKMETRAFATWTSPLCSKRRINIVKISVKFSSN